MKRVRVWPFTVRSSKFRRSVRRELRGLATKQCINTDTVDALCMRAPWLFSSNGSVAKSTPHPCRSRLARPSKCGFQIVITTHVAYLIYAPSLFLALYAVLVKQTLSRVKIEKFIQNTRRSTWQENRLFTRRVTEKWCIRVVRGEFSYKIKRRASTYYLCTAVRTA